MTVAAEELPNDVAALQQLLVAERTGRQAAIDAAVKAQIDEAVDAAVKAAVATILRRYYGPRSERFDPRQLFLFGQQVDQSPLDEKNIAEVRRSLPAGLRNDPRTVVGNCLST